MDIPATQLGMGAIVALLIIKEFRGFIREQREKKGNPNNAGARSVEFWQLEHRKAIAEAFSATILPVLNRQTEILGKIENTNGSIYLLLTKVAGSRGSSL